MEKCSFLFSPDVDLWNKLRNQILEILNIVCCIKSTLLIWMIIKCTLLRQNVNNRRGSYIGQLTHLFQQQNHPVTASCQSLIITTINWKTSEAASTMSFQSLLFCIVFHASIKDTKWKSWLAIIMSLNEKRLLKYNVLVLVAGSCLHINQRITH